MNDDSPQYQWTAKLPELILGAAAILVGLLFMRRGWLVIGAVLVAVALVVITDSTTIHAWCAPRGSAAFGQEWGSGFWHGPSVHDCIRLIYRRW